MPAVAAFTLTTPGVPAAYTLVTANDAPERDPTSWVLSCATPGSSTYTPMDTITAHDTSTYGRYVSYGAFMIVVPPPGAPKPPPAPPGTMVPYIGCEFRVTANAGGSREAYPGEVLWILGRYSWFRVVHKVQSHRVLDPFQHLLAGMGLLVEEG